MKAQPIKLLALNNAFDQMTKTMEIKPVGP
jgi:hypothetical protein